MCPLGTGTDYLFKIKRGEGFLVVMSALLFCASTGATLYILKKPTNELHFGMVVMLNAMCAVLALMVAFNEASYGL